MKIRSGFVSNSSSSSFCILGKEISKEEVNKASEHLNIEWAIAEWDDTVYGGLCPEKMNDEETLLQFKERIVEGFKKAGIEITSDELDWITDGGYNG